MMTHAWKCRAAAFLLCIPCAAFIAFTTPSAFAADTTKSKFSVPAGDAATTLRQFSEQSGAQVVFPVSQVRGVTTHAVSGEMLPREALDQMVAGTDLAVTRDEKTGALAVSRVQMAVAQKTSATPPPAPVKSADPAASTEEESITLSPFEVRTDKDNGYGALQSNSLTAFRMDLDKMPATAQVFNRTFIDDMAATSAQAVLLRFSGTVTADPNNTGSALTMPGDRDGSGGGLGIRGLAAPSPKRDSFLGIKSSDRSSFGYNDLFDIERVELVEGPQGVLYGAVGGGGVVNLVSKQAQFSQQKGYVRYQLDQYGSKRAEFDYNIGLNKVAVRVALVDSDQQNFRYNLGTELKGMYVQVAYKIAPATTIRVFHELSNSFANVEYKPSLATMSTFFPVGDPRRSTNPLAQTDVRYLALTGQLIDLQGVLYNGPVDYQHISSLAGWWSSETIKNNYNGLSFESKLGWGFSMQMTAVYSETTDDRMTAGKNIVPGAGLAGAGTNPWNGTAIQLTNPGDNWQSDRTKGIRALFMHDGQFLHNHAHSQTALGFEGYHQGPAFGSSGIDRMYYQADANWNPIISPTVTTDYGRIPLSTAQLGGLYIPIQNGIALKGGFKPGTRRITMNGVNYILEPRIYQSASLVTPANPFGLIPNTPGTGTGYSGNWNRGGETHSRSAFLANYTDWYDGAVTTVMGMSVNRFETLNAGAGSAPTFLAPRNYTGWEVAANARVWKGIRAFATVSTAAQAAGTTKDFYGVPLKVPKAESPQPEIGFKYNSENSRLQVQLVYDLNTKVVNETRNVGTDFFLAVNPTGINGKFNSGDQWINLDRKASSIEFTVTATPTKNWRVRFQATHPDGEITSTVAYKQLYNDQFYTTNGIVTYKDGTPVLVEPSNNPNLPKNTPLTLAMINDKTSPYWSNPAVNSGSITGVALKTALTTIDPVHGAAATGVTGLPISNIQYDFGGALNNGLVTIVQAGDKNTGLPEYNFNLQSNYTFDSGFLKGVGILASMETYLKSRTWYTQYYSTGANTLQPTARLLYGVPTATVFGLGLSYTHKLFGKYSIQSQINVNNLLNHYRVWVLPSSANGANLQGRLSAQPRQFIWTNTISF